MKEKTNENSVKNQVTATLNEEKICPKCGEIHQGDCPWDDLYFLLFGTE